MVIVRALISFYGTSGSSGLVKETYRSKVKIREDEDFVQVQKALSTLLGIRVKCESLGIAQ